MKKYQSVIFVIGAALVLIGAVSYITRWTYSPYIYSVGAVSVAIIQFLSPYEGKDVIMKRLRRQQIFGALFLMVAGVLMFTLPRGNEWMLALTVAALLELYTAFRMPQAEEKK